MEDSSDRFTDQQRSASQRSAAEKVLDSQVLSWTPLDLLVGLDMGTSPHRCGAEKVLDSQVRVRVWGSGFRVLWGWGSGLGV